MKFAMSVAGVAMVHFFVTIFLTFVVGTTGSGNRALVLAAKILGFPLSVIKGPENLPPFLGWMPVILLSLAWGFAICAGMRFFMSSGR